MSLYRSPCNEDVLNDCQSQHILQFEPQELNPFYICSIIGINMNLHITMLLHTQQFPFLFLKKIFVSSDPLLSTLNFWPLCPWNHKHTETVYIELLTSMALKPYTLRPIFLTTWIKVSIIMLHILFDCFSIVIYLNI